MKKIYFCASVTGGRENADIYAKIVKRLKENYIVLTEHLADPNLSSMGEGLSQEEIYRRDVDYLENADIVIAECSTASLGVGYELCYAEKLGLPTYVLFKNQDGKRLSAMIGGDKYFTVIYYDDLYRAIEEVIKIMEK
ncbi:MAG: nucleoside 2-deoxyribosyltransferase [Eubacteriaceae bacterium]|nr:nucleoside 2-deoxyribosyltransferase [Eubacteriaceae bacterium]